MKGNNSDHMQYTKVKYAFTLWQVGIDPVDPCNTECTAYRYARALCDVIEGPKRSNNILSKALDRPFMVGQQRISLAGSSVSEWVSECTSFVCLGGVEVGEGGVTKQITHSWAVHMYLGLFVWVSL